ncbi:MAG TPA: hypothetical protein VIG50_06840 [Vicinamibacteria bacterium]|jgi:hypothetical protein
MTRWTGGSKVPAGFYWRKSAWEMVTLSGEGGVLPGGRDERYFKVPVLAMLALAPAMGAALVMFLPLMGFMMAGREIVRKARTAAGRPRATVPARKAA